MIPWTTGETFLLIGLWPIASAAQISRWLNRSRGAICGKAMRLRRDGLLPCGGKEHFEGRPRPAPPPSVHRIMPAKPPPAANGSVPPLDMQQPCALLELDDRRCHWPLGDVHQVATLFCGGATVPGRCYCAHHLRRARAHGSARRI
jgi:hypothetical protein